MRSGSPWSRVLLALAVVGSLVACEERRQPVAGPPVSTPTPEAREPSPTTSGSGSPAITSGPPPAPAPKARIPTDPKRLAERLTRNHRAVMRAADAWRKRSEGGRPLSLEALYQQRIYRLLGREPDLARAVIRRLPGAIERFARSNVAAVRALLSLVVPIEPPIRLRPTRPARPLRLMRFYREGEAQTGIPWELLASVNFVETRFGRVMGPSTAGAVGPMQFLPSTWEQYGGGGDIMDPRDSILAAARYLSVSGAPSDTRAALFAYNRSYAYVDAIELYAREMMRDERAFHAYYFWQVFVTTTKGDVQLTGPGSRGSR